MSSQIDPSAMLIGTGYIEGSREVTFTFRTDLSQEAGNIHRIKIQTYEPIIESLPSPGREAFEEEAWRRFEKWAALPKLAKHVPRTGWKP